MTAQYEPKKKIKRELSPNELVPGGGARGEKRLNPWKDQREGATGFKRKIKIEEGHRKGAKIKGKNKWEGEKAA